jgi:hypothetical protein
LGKRLVAIGNWGRFHGLIDKFGVLSHGFMNGITSSVTCRGSHNRTEFDLDAQEINAKGLPQFQIAGLEAI